MRYQNSQLLIKLYKTNNLEVFHIKTQFSTGVRLVLRKFNLGCSSQFVLAHILVFTGVVTKGKNHCFLNDISFEHHRKYQNSHTGAATSVKVVSHIGLEHLSQGLRLWSATYLKIQLLTSYFRELIFPMVVCRPQAVF
jgi:hypothetical protein